MERTVDDNMLYIDIDKLQETLEKTKTALGFDLVICVWSPGKQPFIYDPVRLAAHLASAVPGRKYTAKFLAKHRDDAALFFTVLPDGRWAPRPDLFSISDEAQ